MFSRPRILISLTLIVLSLTGAALADVVTFDAQTLGATYGVPTGMLPGDAMFSEGGADLYLAEFMIGGNPYFNFAQIDPPYTGPTIFFGSGNILETNNVGVFFVFSSPGNVTFEYLNLGGSVNVQVNGAGTVLEGSDLASLAGPVAPGVNMSVTVVPTGGAVTGVVTLTGPVEKLRIGGQEFWIDRVQNDNGIPGGDCDREVTHQTLPVGSTWGSATEAPGDLIFTEDGIPVFIDVIDWGTGVGFNYCQVQVPGIVGFGFDRVMNLNNVSNRYAIGASGITTSQVTFEYADLGGLENLQVNGAGLYVGDLAAAPAAIAPGVFLSVVTFPITGGVRGEVTLTGDVQELLVAGQEFMIDDLCVVEGLPPGDCDILSENESLSAGTSWGGSYGQSPGDLVFNEAGVDAGVDLFDYGTGTLFNQLLVGTPWGPNGSSHVLHVNNIGVFYNLAPLGGVASVRFDYCTGGGIENLAVDGLRYVGDFEAIPAGFFPGCTVNVAYTNGPGYTFGTVTIVGPVGRLLIGGQELYIDNLCVELDWVADVPVASASDVEMGPNVPNPFNPSTTLQYSLARSGPTRLTIVDLSGSLVATLVNEVLPAGSRTTVWDGRDDRGRPAASGMYFARLENGGSVAVRKIAMLK